MKNWNIAHLLNFDSRQTVTLEQHPKYGKDKGELRCEKQEKHVSFLDATDLAGQRSTGENALHGLGKLNIRKQTKS